MRKVLVTEPIGPTEKIDLINIDMRSDEIREIISKPPPWLVRWGITAFFGVLALILLASWIIKYPEIIRAPLRLTAVNAPKTINSKITGKLVNLLVQNNTVVVEEDVLAWLESTANHEEVLELSIKIDSMQLWLANHDLHLFKTTPLKNYANIGELQSSFQAFEQAYREFISFLDGGFYSHKRVMLQKEMEYNHSLLQQLEKQKQIQERDYTIASQGYQAQKKLAIEGVIAPLELKIEESKLLSKKIPLEQLESSIINNYAFQLANRKELLELDQQIGEQQSVFLQVLNSLKSSVDEWKSQYLLTAPLKGKLIYAGLWQENQTVTSGEEIFYVIPDNANYFGKLIISQHSFGKIQEDQQVLVKFDGYPYQEFGSVLGKISYLSDIPVKDSVFLAKVSFENKLQTNYGKEIYPVNGMIGQAEIITQDMRLLARMYHNIRELGK